MPSRFSQGFLAHADEAAAEDQHPDGSLGQAGVAWATCCRSVIQRMTMSHANKIIPAALTIHWI